MDRLDKNGESMNWTAHLDIVVFIMVFYPLAVEYFLWRLNQ